MKLKPHYNPPEKSSDALDNRWQFEVDIVDWVHKRIAIRMELDISRENASRITRLCESEKFVQHC